MKRGRNLNPIFHDENYKKRRSNRKTRSDKKDDIKIYVLESTYYNLLRKSSSLNISMTKLVSNAFYTHFRRGYDYQMFKYVITDYMVHVKLCEQDKQILNRLKGDWGIKTKRQAATNVFNNILFIRGV